MCVEVCVVFDRVMRDVEAVRQEATLLKEQMHTVKEDIKKVHYVIRNYVMVMSLSRLSVRRPSRCRSLWNWTQ